MQALAHGTLAYELAEQGLSHTTIAARVLSPSTESVTPDQEAAPG